MAAVCPAGHESATTDYCDTCGAPMTAAEGGPPAGGTPGQDPAAEAPVGEATAATACPACGEPVSGRFCESCGYDVEAGVPAGPPPVTLLLGADRRHWERMVGSGEPAFPAVPPSLTFELAGDRATVGRGRSGGPTDVDVVLTGVAADPAVSQRQCAFERTSAGWTVRDLGSANGTWINDAEAPLAEGEAHTLADGDRVLMGAWTCLTVRIGAPTAAPPGQGAPAAG